MLRDKANEFRLQLNWIKIKMTDLKPPLALMYISNVTKAT